MARSKADLGGVGKASGEVPAEPIGEFRLGEVGHPLRGVFIRALQRAVSHVATKSC